MVEAAGSGRGVWRLYRGDLCGSAAEPARIEGGEKESGVSRVIRRPMKEGSARAGKGDETGWLQGPRDPDTLAGCGRLRELGDFPRADRPDGPRDRQGRGKKGSPHRGWPRRLSRSSTAGTRDRPSRKRGETPEAGGCSASRPTPAAGRLVTADGFKTTGRRRWVGAACGRCAPQAGRQARINGVNIGPRTKGPVGREKTPSADYVDQAPPSSFGRGAGLLWSANVRLANTTAAARTCRRRGGKLRAHY